RRHKRNLFALLHAEASVSFSFDFVKSQSESALRRRHQGKIILPYASVLTLCKRSAAAPPERLSILFMTIVLYY
ncbi:MAG: hypothetical protein KHZ29_04130, partial [Desulfovibrionaceae bacterium]|nr:hypothetical protein [Desulfovibrionaceae bacterium]